MTVAEMVEFASFCTTHHVIDPGRADVGGKCVGWHRPGECEWVALYIKAESGAVISSPDPASAHSRSSTRLGHDADVWCKCGWRTTVHGVSGDDASDLLRAAYDAHLWPESDG